MPIVIAMFSKNKEENSELSLENLINFSFPHDFNISSGLIQNILNYLKDQEVQQTIQMPYGDNTILIVKILENERSNDSYIFLILNPDEYLEVDDFTNYLQETSHLLNYENIDN
jgi:hypothetical protein